MVRRSSAYGGEGGGLRREASSSSGLPAVVVVGCGLVPSLLLWTTAEEGRRNGEPAILGFYFYFFLFLDSKTTLF